MKILILGGTGLISTAITRQLLARGDEVALFNRGQTAPRFEQPVKTFHGDRKDLARFEAQMAGAGFFDGVIDMICFHPEEAESLVRAFRGRTGHLIFCSTVEVYSKAFTRQVIREDEPRQSNSEYGRNKTLCEDILLKADHAGLFPVTIIRPAYTYGEGGKLISTFGWKTTYLDRIRKAKPVVLPGDGNAPWAACHVDDMARVFVGAIANTHAFGKAYHAAGQEWLNWNRKYQGIAQALGAPAPQFVHIPSDLLARIAPQQARWAVENVQSNILIDSSAAQDDLGFRCTVSWVEGVRRTVAWLDAQGQIENSDDDPFDERIIAAWQRLSSQMIQDLADLES